MARFRGRFTFGRRLDRMLVDCLTRAWAAGAGPDDQRLVVGIDPFGPTPEMSKAPGHRWGLHVREGGAEP